LRRHRRWTHAVRHSIQGRLVALFLLLALATSAVFLYGMQRVLQGGWQGYAKPIVADYLDRLAAELGSPPDPARALALTERLPLSVRIEGPSVQFDSHPRRRRVIVQDDEVHDYGAEGWGLVRRSADGHRITFGLAGPAPGVRPRVFGWVTLALLLALTALAFFTVRRLLAPLEEIGRAVESFGEGRFDRPIAVQRDDELGALATRINAMAASLSDKLEAKRALLLAISHELRSPLTRARINADLVADGPEREALLRDLGEMRDLITSLLESERLAQGHAALQPEPTDLAALVRDLCQTQFADAPLVLQLEDIGGVQSVDPTRLRLLLRNLVGNALRHQPDGAAPIEVFMRRETDGRLALGVRDHGPGVPAEQLPKLAQAFYRPDSARSRSTGGVGLGLYLCRLVAQAHGGELRIRRAEPGLEVAMRWPAGS
jgi:signal transduction histidine kinase